MQHGVNEIQTAVTLFTFVYFYCCELRLSRLTLQRTCSTGGFINVRANQGGAKSAGFRQRTPWRAGISYQSAALSKQK